jgi:hypothetical protein
MKTLTLVRGSMNNDIEPSREPNPELVECAIVEVLEIAQRQGITPADFIQLLDSGIRISDFLAALQQLAKAKNTIDCDS